MNALEEVFPNITKLKLARDLCSFLDWAWKVHGVELGELDTGEPLSTLDAVAEFVDIDQAALKLEMLHLEEVVAQERRGHLVH